MPRDLVIGNGSLLIGFDAQYRVADLYYPHVGMENHAATRFLAGVWCGGALHPLHEAPWRRSLDYLRDTLVTDVICDSPDLGLRLHIHDVVDPHSDVHLRKLVVRNTHSARRDIKLFLHQALSIYGSPVGDTALYEPQCRSLIHYKANRYFLFSCSTESHAGIDEYSCGRNGVGGVETAWSDAADGALSLNAIAQGSVASIMAVPLQLEANGSATVFAWMCAGKDLRTVRLLHEAVLEETPALVMSRSASHWYTWVNKPGDEMHELPDELGELYRRSLLVISTQIDRDGAVLAANDSDIQWGHNDHYSYMWARDSAFVCDALDRAGFPEFTRRFLRFVSRLVTDEGYILHKYHPDGSLAPLWQPWVRDGKRQLPIQEDATALLVWLVARHYERTRDLELARDVYLRLVVAPAEFLLTFRDEEGLPLPSYDLWEERQGVFFFTCCTVFAALEAASRMSALFNDRERHLRYAAAAQNLRNLITRHFWREEEQRFARGYLLAGERRELDLTVDASLFAGSYFGVFPPKSAMMESTMRTVKERLWVQTEVGGIARYEGDEYHRISEESSSRVPGNPWLICTLWLAEYSLARATTAGELQPALDLLRWARSKATPSMLLPEQINPYDGTPLSVAPFTWSHAQVVSVAQGYVAALRALRQRGSGSLAENRSEVRQSDPVDNH